MKPYYSLSDFPDRKSAGKNFVAVCPKCGTPHLSISKAKGVYHCFYAGCNFNGILTDFCKADRPMFPQYAAGAAGYAPTRSGNRYKTARHSSRTDSVLCSLVAGISWFFLVCFYWIINFT